LTTTADSSNVYLSLSLSLSLSIFLLSRRVADCTL
jgi:hypothetical protein